ncbi:MAG: hypothetical protein NZ811_02015 [Gammaproteobacteria bacterium]|nr:hypothetical protein [Gammaproteobacteria bacterium]
MKAYSTNVVDNKFRGYPMSELNRLKGVYRSNIEAIISDEKLSDVAYFESMMIEYEKLSELKELVIWELQNSSIYLNK